MFLILDRVQLPVPVDFNPFSGIYAYYKSNCYISVLQLHVLLLLSFDCDVILMYSTIKDDEKSSLNWVLNPGLLTYCANALTTELLRPITNID